MNDWSDRASDSVNDWSDRASDSVNDWSERATDRYDEVEEVFDSYGREAARNLESTISTYGREAGRQIQQAYEVFEGETAARISELYEEVGGRAVAHVVELGERYGTQVGEQLVTLYETYQPRVCDAIIAGYENFGRPMGDRVMELALRIDGSSDYFSDEPTLERAIISAAEVVIAVEDFRTSGRGIIYDQVSSLADTVEVQHADGRTLSLREFAQDWVVTEVPSLAGSSIAEDPVEAFMYGVVYGDSDFVLNELRVIPSSDGEYLSLSQTVIAASPMDVDATIEMIEIADDVYTLADGDLTEDDVTALADLISAAQESQNGAE